MHWFEKLKINSSQLYDVLYAMPKGGDLHNHLSGAGFPQWWYDIAVNAGYLQKLSADETDRWKTKTQNRWHTRPMCKKPLLLAELVYRNMVAFAEENVRYVEFQVNASDILMRTLTHRLEQQDAIDTNVTVRFQATTIRRSNVNKKLQRACQLVLDHDMCVGVNVGGHELQVPPSNINPILDIPFSCHAGEMLEANTHVRDSLAIGADRIGHGINLITDHETMIAMNKPIEVCLLSNLYYNRITEYDQYPLRAYIDNGIPVVLCTDNRGLQQSTLTDEYFAAVTTFNLTWNEVKQISRNSLVYAFVDETTKKDLLNNYDVDMLAFEIACTTR